MSKKLVDAYRIHSESASDWLIQACTNSRDVFSPATSTRKTYEAGCSSAIRGTTTTRRSCRNQIEPSLHGDAWCGENHISNNYQLHAWSHAFNCEDKGRIPKTYSGLIPP